MAGAGISPISCAVRRAMRRPATGAYRRDGRPRIERKPEGAEEEQPSASDGEPTGENSEDFASS